LLIFLPQAKSPFQLVVCYGIEMKSLRGRTADQSVDKRELYVAFAAHCLHLAKVAADHQSRAVLREMAAEWPKLAEVAS
jgi:hypothetical protein